MPHGISQAECSHMRLASWKQQSDVGISAFTPEVVLNSLHIKKLTPVKPFSLFPAWNISSKLPFSKWIQINIL